MAIKSVFFSFARLRRFPISSICEHKHAHSYSYTNLAVFFAHHIFPQCVLFRRAREPKNQMNENERVSRARGMTHCSDTHRNVSTQGTKTHTRHGTARHGARFSSEELFAVLLFSFCSFSCPVLSFHFVCARRYERIRALLYIRVYRTDYSAAAASNRPTNHYMLIRTHTNDEEMCEEQLGE